MGNVHHWLMGNVGHYASAYVYGIFQQPAVLTQLFVNRVVPRE